MPVMVVVRWMVPGPFGLIETRLFVPTRSVWSDCADAPPAVISPNTLARRAARRIVIAMLPSFQTGRFPTANTHRVYHSPAGRRLY
jgi:hypothetical protein